MPQAALSAFDQWTFDPMTSGQSTLAQRVAANEDRHDKVDQTCKQLDEADKKLDQQAKSIHNELIEKIKKWKSDFILLQK